MTAVQETGLCNARDVGGLPTVDGGAVRPGMLLRSDLPLPGDPPPQGIACWPPATVLDLRAPTERTGPHPLAVGGSTVHEVPLFDDLTLRGTRDGDWPEPDAIPGWFDSLYLRCLRERAGAVGRAVAVLVTAPAPVLVHCAAGRDRTGIVVALALAAAGVERTAIVADYRRTEDNHLRLMARLSRRGAPAAARSRRLRDEVLATPGAIERVLDEVDAHPGGVRGWLVGHGVPGPELDRWCAAVVG